ncbi:Down syndrome cell adhesion molecule-like protein Dscam2 [Nymphon striatum]|nr:Down syndrome cell adhesion molecule-like protein Dscam2 [Nymphon striatum]
MHTLVISVNISLERLANCCQKKNRKINLLHWTNIYCRPPRKIEFLNTYGAVINCLVHGDPIPKVQWINKNGQNVEDIHGLLKKLENNSLSLPKFDNGLYRQNIHATTYICKASNKYGTIISREIQVTAVVDQQYSTQVYDEYVIEGNTALLKCIIPSYIKDQIIVTAWIRDDGVRISSEYQQDSRYLILNTGDLNIFNVRYGDSDNVYKCQTKHTVSGEVKVTDVGGKLHVTKPSSGIQPRIVYSTPSMNIVSGSEITLSSVAQGFPAPAYSWCYQKYRGLSCEEITKSTEKTIVGNSLIIRASMKDSGFYVCKAENKMGDDTVKLKLTVFAPLSAFIHPQRQIVDIGQAINIGCVISGGPFTFIKWFKDGKFLKKDIEKLNSSKSSLHISNVEKTTEGMYQCFVGNVMDEKQAIGQIILSAVPPTIVKEFKMQHKRSGQSLTLECAATGDPLPQIQWILRDSIIKKSFGLNIESKVDSGKIWSKLTINILQISNSGIYKCIAKNKAGKDMYSNTLHVYGPPRVWPLMNQTVVTGKSVFIQCHVSGYPISSINWKKDDEDLLENERIKIYSNGSLKILSAIRDIDNGKYKCTAENEEGYTSSGSGILRILVAPILNEINDQSLRFGRRLSLYCSLTAGDPPIEFTWLYNGQALPHYLGLVVSDSTYSSTLNHQNIRGEHMGNYTCIAKNNPGSASVSAFIKVEAPPEWLMKPTSVEVHLGESISLPCTGKGFPQPKSTWLKLKGRQLEKLGNLQNERIIYKNGTLSLISISEDDLQITYRCKISNRIQPSLAHCLINTSLLDPRSYLQWCIWEVKEGGELGSVIILFKLNTGGDNKAGSDDNKDFGYPLFTSIITPTDESYKNDSSRDVHFRSVAILYIIPTVTAAVILLVILIIVCILLQRQREKRTKYKNEESEKVFPHLLRRESNPPRKLEHSNMRSQNLEEDDKISDFYKTSSVTSSSNKYYEIRPHHPYQQSHSSAFKPVISRICSHMLQSQVFWEQKHSIPAEKIRKCCQHSMERKNLYVTLRAINTTSWVVIHTECTDLTPTSKNGNLNWAEHSTRRTDGRWATKTTIWNQISSVIALCEECDFILSLGHETEKPGHLHSNRRTSTDKSVQCSRSSINVEKDTKKIKPTQKIKKSHKYTAKIKHIILIKQMDLNRLIKNTQINNVEFHLKRKVYDQCILPVLTYGSETWEITDTLLRKLAECPTQYGKKDPRCISHEAKGTGPIFILEPQRKVAFLNSHGTVINCLVHGEPTPTVHWINKRNELVQDVSGLLRNLANNSLSLSKFSNGQYQQAIHATTYRCKATNKYGTIISRKVYVTAVVDQQYSTQVYDEYVIEGNTAVLKCIIPSYIKDYVKVTAWIKDDKIEITNKYEKDSKYLIMGNGNLIIIRVNMDDALSMYKCQTKHLVSKQVVITHNGGKLHITTPSSGIAPKIIESSPELQSRPGERIILPCLFQGYPSPSYSWCFKKTMKDQCKSLTDAMEERLIGSSLILTSSDKDSGFYVCVAANEMGKETSVVKLTVFVLPEFDSPETLSVTYPVVTSSYTKSSCATIDSECTFKGRSHSKVDLDKILSAALNPSFGRIAYKLGISWY